MGLQGIQAKRYPEFTASSVPQLASLIADHQASVDNMGACALMVMDVNVATCNLEDKEFKLMMSKLEHDIAVFNNYKNQMANEESAAYHERLTYMQQRCKHASTTVEKLFASEGRPLSNRHECVKITRQTKANDIMNDFTGFMKSISHIHSIPLDKITVVGYANWASMSLIAS